MISNRYRTFLYLYLIFDIVFKSVFAIWISVFAIWTFFFLRVWIIQKYLFYFHVHQRSAVEFLVEDGIHVRGFDLFKAWIWTSTSPGNIIIVELRSRVMIVRMKYGDDKFMLFTVLLREKNTTDRLIDSPNNLNWRDCLMYLSQQALWLRR